MSADKTDPRYQLYHFSDTTMEIDKNTWLRNFSCEMYLPDEKLWMKYERPTISVHISTYFFI